MSKIAEAGNKGGELVKQVGSVVYWGIRLTGLLILLAGLALWIFTGIDIIWPIAVSIVGLLALFPVYTMLGVAHSGNLLAIAVGLVFVSFGLLLFITEGRLIFSVLTAMMGLVAVSVGLIEIRNGNYSLAW